MSLDERLRAATIPDAAFDVEGDISDVRRRAGRIRRRRTGAAACALTLLVAAAVIVWPRSSDDATIDTADSADTWFLPASVPDGYQLAWVDPPSARPNETGGADPWVGTYAYGYQSPTVEFDTRIIVGADLDDPAATAAVLDDGGSADEVNGRGAVRWRSDGATVRLLVELDGAVAHVIVHPRGASFPDPPPLPPDHVVDGYAASITRIDEAAWRAALESGADVADRYGPLDGKVVVEGDGWQVLDGDSRPPFSVRHRAVWARIGQVDGSAVGAPPEQGDFWSEEILEADGVRVAWGLAPSSSRIARLRIGDQILTENTVAFDGWRVWAIDVSELDTSDTRVEFLDADGTVVGDGPVATVHPPDPDDLPMFSSDSDPPIEAAEIADRLACDSTGDGMPYVDPAGPKPLAALLCQIGDADLNITVYASQQDVTAALVAAAPFCGHRAVGLDWIVVTNTPEAADRAASALGASSLTLPGCAGG